FAAILFILSIAPSAQAQHDNECSTATLRGTYGYFFSGSAAGVGPVAAVGPVALHCPGGGSAKDTLHNSRAVVRRSGSGMYLVNSNCTGSALITVDAGQFSFDLMVIPGSSGAEFSLIVTNSGAIQTGEAIRIGEEECTLATLQGVYRLSGSN